MGQIFLGLSEYLNFIVAIWKEKKTAWPVSFPIEVTGNFFCLTFGDKYFALSHLPIQWKEQKLSCLNKRLQESSWKLNPKFQVWDGLNLARVLGLESQEKTKNQSDSFSFSKNQNFEH